MPNAIVDATQKWVTVGPQILVQLRLMGAQISPAEEAAIKKEVLTHPKELFEAIEELDRVVKANV